MLDGSNRDVDGGDPLPSPEEEPSGRIERPSPPQQQLKGKQGDQGPSLAMSPMIGSAKAAGAGGTLEGRRQRGLPPPSPLFSMSNHTSVFTPGAGTPRFMSALVSGSGGGGGGGGGWRRGEWGGGERLPSASSAMRTIEASGSNARSARRKSKGMGQAS